MEGSQVSGFLCGCSPPSQSCKELYSSHAFTVKTSIPLPSFPWWISNFKDTSWFHQNKNQVTTIWPAVTSVAQYVSTQGIQVWVQPWVSCLPDQMSLHRLSLGRRMHLNGSKPSCLPENGFSQCPVCWVKVKRSWTILMSDTCNNI